MTNSDFDYSEMYSVLGTVGNLEIRDFHGGDIHIVNVTSGVTLRVGGCHSTSIIATAAEFLLEPFSLNGLPAFLVRKVS